ncbi:SAM-dependent methyltransferase [Haladaptatus sp. CMAA 1911]|uniref:SAM-dependent methyltransferase n=1 Tax=unclassified Haladaptatus TaxID=2622732 RepID=UPI003754E05E
MGKGCCQDRTSQTLLRGDEFWDDPYISEQLLEAHLDRDRDAASRPHDRIDAEVEWLISALSLEAGDAILDLGCRPGLYCERLYDHGMNVTGVDVSQTALDHARTRAENTGRDITYRRKDYRTLDDDAAFDAVLVNFDFGTFADGDRNEILRGVHDALIPDGRFAIRDRGKHLIVIAGQSL